jgi:hypothetical protein
MEPRQLASALVFALTAFGAGCATARIPNSEVPDTRANREAIEVSERYRRAVEQRDVPTLLALAAPNYYEDASTPQGDDDYGYDGLRRLLSVWAEEVLAVRYEMHYHNVAFENDGQRALVEYTYTGSFTLRRTPLQLPEGVTPPQESMFNTDPARGGSPVSGDQEVWYRRVADNRLELEKVNGQWRIVAGM